MEVLDHLRPRIGELPHLGDWRYPPWADNTRLTASRLPPPSRQRAIIAGAVALYLRRLGQPQPGSV
jgi:hypothetical protein